jgi:hypothetical protein
MGYLKHNGKLLKTSNKLLFFNAEPTYQLSFDLTVIRNAEMNNKIGNAGSTNLSITGISGDLLTIQNLPDYEGFKRTNTWAIVQTSGGNLASPSLCTSINYSTSQVKVATPGYFNSGNTVALFNPFLNYEFTGNQTSTPSISPNNLSGWGQLYTGGGPMFKVGSTYKWLFYAIPNETYKYGQVGLATSTDMATWAVQNSGGPWITREQLDCSSFTLTGDIGMIDGSYYCAMSWNNPTSNKGEVRILFFDQNASSLSYTGMLKDNAASGGVIKIGNEWHMLYTDISTALQYRTIKAAKANNIEGPYTDYQSIVYAADPVNTPAGVCWNIACDSPTIHSINGYIFGLFGAQGDDYLSGVGSGNRQHCLLDFDSNTQTWSISTKGPVLINPLQWNTVAGTYLWAIDHDGQGQCILIDGSSAFLANTFNASSDTYRATMTKLKNFVKS